MASGPQQEALALAVIGAGFHHAVDLLENSARAPGWLHQDPGGSPNEIARALISMMARSNAPTRGRIH
jgi:hypothetical protein